METVVVQENIDGKLVTKTFVGEEMTIKWILDGKNDLVYHYFENKVRVLYSYYEKELKWVMEYVNGVVYRRTDYFSGTQRIVHYDQFGVELRDFNDPNLRGPDLVTRCGTIRRI